MQIKIRELPETERPYEKLEMHGEKILSNAELLAIIIKTGTKEETSVEIAQKILKLNNKKENDLSFLRELSIEELMMIKGIGKVKALQIKAMCELAVRMTKPDNYRKVIIKSPDDIAKVLLADMKIEKQEKVKVVIMNNKNEILKISDVAIGSTNSANVSIKDILALPIKMQAPKIILVHNHPSGDSKPSKQDLVFTEKIYNAAKTFEIELIDHLVIGDMCYTSIFSEFLEKNIMNT